ncbi:MAG: aminotransferase class I/II-fold pyridoxal phosphate-dependent enzyme, partial [Microscillaceae bacterium]|nr:aminotransferase class I/II-fold pyridoxal phosphate-dependent enzyme [Microscillaceae bacterium]
MPLQSDFQIDSNKVLEMAQAEALKIIFVCSPNNPTGNRMDPKSVLQL